MNVEIGDVYSTGIPSLDEKIGIGGFHVYNWIALIGEPGTLKTVYALTMARKWISIPNNCVIYVTSETNPKDISNQFKSLYLDVSNFVSNGQFVFVDVFSDNTFSKQKIIKIENTPDNICRKVTTLIATTLKKFKDAGGKIMLVIDSISMMWKSAPAKARDIYAMLAAELKTVIDICVFTMQLSIGTEHGFGFGAEHESDVIMRFVSYYDGKVGKKYLVQIDKFRGSSHSSIVYHTYLNEKKEILIDSPVNCDGKYRNIYELVDNFKYMNKNIAEKKVIEDRNEMLKLNTTVLIKYMKNTQILNIALIALLDKLIGKDDTVTQSIKEIMKNLSDSK